MNRWLFYITASLLITTGTGTFLYAQNSYNQNNANQYVPNLGYPSSYNNNQNKSVNLRTGNQPSYYPVSGIGTAGLSSFMRDSSSTDNLSKYLTNNNPTAVVSNYGPTLTSSQTMTSVRQSNSQLEEIQNQLNSLYLQAGTQSVSDSEEITRRLANISQQLNNLQQKLEKDNHNANTVPSTTPPCHA